MPGRSDVASDNPIPVPPFWGTRVVKGVAVADYAGMVDERALFLGQWGLRGARGGVRPVVRGAGRDRGPSAAALLAGAPVHRGRAGARRRRLRVLPGRRRRRRARGPRRAEARRAGAHRFAFPRQRRDRHLCLADFWRPRELAVERSEVDVLPLHLVTMGQPIADYANELFAKDAYRDYLEVHGLGRAAHRGARRVLAPRGSARSCASPRARPSPPGTEDVGESSSGLPRCALLVGLRRLPEPRRPREDRRSAASPSASA